jgi:NAD(P)-dependent dehydrogenase (short-subunit alcohol dehydrogenase family)
MLDFEGRVIIVTGAGRGMGAAHARALVERGARVVVNDLGGSLDGSGSDNAPAEAVARQIRDLGGRAVTSTETVATSAGANAIVAQTIAEFGQLDGVLHNAGISTLVPLAQITDEQWEQMLRVHLYGAFYLTRAAWSHLAQRRGRILYISSAVGFYGVPEMAHYGAAKTGMIGLSRVAATEGRAAGIAVNVLGVAASTRMMDLAMVDSPKLTAWFAKYMKPELPSAAAVWLLHPQCPASGRIYEAFGPHMAEVLIAETSGYTKFGITPEDVRDHFDKITDRSQFIVPDGPDDFHARTFKFIVDAGAEPLETDAGADKLAVAPRETEPD